MKISKFKRFAELLEGEELPTRYKISLRPSEELLLAALQENEAVNVNKLVAGGIDKSSIRTTVCRLREKLPNGVTIITKYGGFYYLTNESKKILERYTK